MAIHQGTPRGSKPIASTFKTDTAANINNSVLDIDEK